jgi:hypothetical protein
MLHRAQEHLQPRSVRLLATVSSIRLLVFVYGIRLLVSVYGIRLLVSVCSSRLIKVRDKYPTTGFSSL